MTDLPIDYSGPEPEDDDFKQSGLTLFNAPRVEQSALI